MATTTPTPTPETTLHPDDGTALVAVAMKCLICPAQEYLVRSDKVVSLDLKQTEYFYTCPSCQARSVLTVPHKPSVTPTL